MAFFWLSSQNDIQRSFKFQWPPSSTLLYFLIFLHIFFIICLCLFLILTFWFTILPRVSELIFLLVLPCLPPVYIVSLFLLCYFTVTFHIHLNYYYQILFYIIGLYFQKKYYVTIVIKYYNIYLHTLYFYCK
uniref:Uncharacterized protein n=1 Tax=Cacopsylla melanoneura TaxID=428564 RepID=A0A8D8SXH1_9HEMI